MTGRSCQFQLLLRGSAVTDVISEGTDQLSAIIEADGRVQGFSELHGEEDVRSPWSLRSICVLLALAHSRWKDNVGNDGRWD